MLFNCFDVNISEWFKQNPYQDFQYENAEAKQLAIEIGVVSQFRTNPKGAKPGQQSQQLVVHQNHPTHWIAIILYLGAAEEKENGFVALCFPKSRGNYSQVMEVLEKILNTTDERITDTRISFDGPAGN